MYKIRKVLLAGALSAIMCLTVSANTIPNVKETVEVETVKDISEPVHIILNTPRETMIDEYIEVVPDYTSDDISVTDEDVELLALVTLAEAENQTELGQRLVVSTILNRVDHDRFPDTIHGVVYQKNAFEAMHNGRVNRVKVTDKMRQLVREEVKSRTDHDVIFFRTGHYSVYGTPMFKEDDHYFSSY